MLCTFIFQKKKHLPNAALLSCLLKHPPSSNKSSLNISFEINTRNIHQIHQYIIMVNHFFADCGASHEAPQP